MKYLLHDSKGFADFSRRMIKGEGPNEYALQKHQLAVREFLSETPYRGLLVFHDLGSGKSCTAVAAMEALKKRRVFVLLPASLKKNFRTEIKKCSAVDPDSVTWVSTNGISADDVTDSSIAGQSTTDSCIIIDEVHNLVSQVSNRGKRGSKLFRSLVFARNCKVIALSGTPIINHPAEVGILLNMIGGANTVYRLSGVPDKRTSLERLKESTAVLSADLEGESLLVSLVPEGFRKTESDGESVWVERDDQATRDAVLQEVKRITSAGMVDSLYRMLFPLAFEVFESKYMTEDGRIKNEEEFMRLASGRVSRHVLSDAAKKRLGFPRVVEEDPYRLPMSDQQLESYIEQRTVEIKIEMRNKNDQSAYRAFSRAVSNFAFDSEIPRYFPSKIRDMLRDMSEGDFSSKYDENIRNTLAALAERPERLRNPGLKEHSPKFSKLLSLLLKSRQKNLVYSQFRRVEGIGVMSLVLEANGFQRLRPESKGKGPYFVDFDPGDPFSETAIQIFNGEGEWFQKNKPDIRVIFLTFSGAEGLNLKGVREVHIMEPYWNEMKIQQVIGRAARLGSHLEFKEADRVVRVHRYLAVLPEKTDSFTLRNVDKNRSTDEIIAGNAMEKYRSMLDFLEALRKASIDCEKDCFSF